MEKNEQAKTKGTTESNFYINLTLKDEEMSTLDDIVLFLQKRNQSIKT